MKFLVDANLSFRVANRLVQAGFAAAHVRDHGLWNAADEEIAPYAVESGSAIISSDSDFARLLAKSGKVAPSLVLLRSVDALTPHAQADLLIRNLPSVLEDLADGAVVSLSTEHLRVRKLPFGN